MATIEDYIRDLTARGLPPLQAQAFARRLYAESGLNPQAFNPAGGGMGAYGLAQWRGPRQAGLFREYGPNPSVSNQLDYAVQELRGPEARAGAMLAAAKTPQQADAATLAYERPGPRRSTLTMAGEQPEATPQQPQQEASNTPFLDHFMQFLAARGGTDAETQDAAIADMQPMPAQPAAPETQQLLPAMSTGVRAGTDAETQDAAIADMQPMPAQPAAPETQQLLPAMSTGVRAGEVRQAYLQREASRSAEGDGTSLLDRFLSAISPIGTAQAGELIPFRGKPGIGTEGTRLRSPAEFAGESGLPASTYVVFDPKLDRGFNNVFNSEKEAKAFVELHPELDYASARDFNQLNPGNEKDLLNFLRANAPAVGAGAVVAGVAGAAQAGEKKESTSLLDRFLNSIGAPGTGGPETGGMMVSPQTAPVFQKGAETVGGAAKAIGGDIKDIAESVSIPKYMEAEKRLLAGQPNVPAPLAAPEAPGPQMGAQELAGFAAGHLAGGAPGGAVSAGIGRGPGVAGGYRARTTPLPPGQVPGATDLIRGASHTIESWFSPTTMDTAAEMAEASIDKGLGQARRETEVANAQLEQSRRLVQPMVLPFQDYVREVQQQIAAGAYAPGSVPHPDALKFIDYIEGRSTGVQLPPELAHLKPLADTMRKLYQERASAIAADPLTNVSHFIDDYFTHQWREKPTTATFTHGTRPFAGSGGPLRKRTIPTLSEGIDAGLTPTSFDPIESTMRYIANMDRFLAVNEIFHEGTSAGIIRFYHHGQAPAGWAPLSGRLAGPTPYGMTAYAPEGYARVYNRSTHVDPGFSQSGPFRFFNQLKNVTTQTLLGFSGYHYLAMTQEAAVSKLGAALGHLKEGELAEAGKKAGLAMGMLPAVIDTARKGAKVRKAYLRQINDPLYSRIAENLAKAGGRVIGRGEEWRGSAMSDYWTAIRRGTLATELRTGLRDVKGGPLSTAPLRAGGLIFREIGRIMETVNKPLFDHLVPNLKAGAFFDEMEAWIARNPQASKWEEMTQARQLWDAMDDRFGEMVMDRLFWNKRLKQALQLVMVSPGWELGSARAIGGGLADIDRGKWTARTRWLVALPPIVALSNAVYQYLRTGKPPEEALDLVVPQTGGTTPEGKPERAIAPGYEKDPLGWYHDPAGKLTGMLNPAAKLPTEMMTGKDYFTRRPIVEDFPGAPSWLQQWGKHIMQNFEPIPLQQMGKTLPGSAIGPGQNILGIRPAPGWLTDPERAKALSKMHDLGETVRSLGSQIYDAKRRGDLGKMRELVKERAKAMAEEKKIKGALPKPKRQSTLSIAPQR